MKWFKLLFLTTLCSIFYILPTNLSAQWLETTIYLSDSLGRVTHPAYLTYNGVNNTVYVGGQDHCVIAIDGVTNQKVAWIPVGQVTQDLCYNPQDNRVYCAAQNLIDDITVIDGATDSVVVILPAGEDRPYAFCYNVQNDKVYCANYIGGSVTVIDGATNAVIATVIVGRLPQALCYNAQDNKVYCTIDAVVESDTVTVIDGATDSVIAIVPVGSGPIALCYNSQNNKVYCANFHSNNVTVIDGSTNQVIATVPAGIEPLALCYNAQDNKVYCGIYYYGVNVTVIDGATDSVIATVPAGAATALCYNPENNKVYCAISGSDNVTVIDGATNDVLTTIGVGDCPLALVHNPQQNRMYVANYMDSSVSVLRDSGGAAIAEYLAPIGFPTIIEIYPNPAKSVLCVRGLLSWPTLDASRLTFRIYDVSGKLIREITPPTVRNDMEMEISLNGINPGVYFLRLGTATKKFLVVR